MSPARKVVIKCILIGTGALITGLATGAVPDNSISLSEGLVALGGAWTLGLGYAGIGATTTLEAIGK